MNRRATPAKPMNHNSDISKRICIIAGMPRSGTTFLYHNLQKHPSLFLPYRKEVEYFSFNYDRGLDWYLKFFAEIRSDQVGCDVAPNYILCPEALQRIKEFNHDVKLIIAVRDPAEMILSLYAQYQTIFYGMPSFEEFTGSYFLKKGSARIHLELTRNSLVSMLEEYRRAFGDNLLIYSFSLFKRDPLLILQSIESFLGIPHYFQSDTFDHRVINSVRRHNIKLVSYLLSRESLISLINLMVPGRSIRYFRGKFDKVSKEKTGQVPASYTPENIQLAREIFAHDSAAVTELFAESEMQLGSGASFHPSPS